MTDAPIEDRAAFDRIRYAQLWEDADVLTTTIGDVAGGDVVSICSAGDNALALLLKDPARVFAVDLSPAQLQCLALRIAAYRNLAHDEFLELMGARASDRRETLLSKALADAPAGTQQFWAALAPEVIAHGAGGVGKFENYFRLFARYVLPVTHPRPTIKALFSPRDPRARQVFYDQRFNTWRWRLMVRLFFSRFVMGRLGRDPAFFDHVDGSVADHVIARCAFAATNVDPAENPYLHWIMTGTHGAALPLPWRPDAYEVIRSRLDRIVPHLGAIDSLVLKDVAGFNLSDIFEYMSPQVQAEVYGALLDIARPGARLIYWNMMAKRRAPEAHRRRIETLGAVETAGLKLEKAFFYRDFVVEAVR
ncbi:MAG: DUF3419 family protein [Pseudomonadota bacterium]